MSRIEEMYRERVAEMAMHERVKRAADMAFWARKIIASQILTERGPRSQQRLKWEVAERVYVADERTQRLIQREMQNVPD